jgi:hypothetical protein
MAQALSEPILLFNDECAVCRLIARWVQKSAARQIGGPPIIVRPIGDDPIALRALNPSLDIWDAYANIHLLMPDGSMKTNGEGRRSNFSQLIGHQVARTQLQCPLVWTKTFSGDP